MGLINEKRGRGLLEGAGYYKNTTSKREAY